MNAAGNTFPAFAHSVCAMPRARLEVFARNVAALARAQQLTPPQLAAKAKVAPKTLNNILNARHAPQLDVMVKIADALGVPLWELYLPELPEGACLDDTLPRLVRAAAQLPPEALRQVTRLAELELRATSPDPSKR